MYKIITLLKRQFIAHTVSIIFLLIGFIVSILLISIGTSAVLGLKQAAIMKENATPQNALAMTYAFSKKSSFDDHLEIIKNISVNSGVMVANHSLYFNEDQSKHPLTAIFFQKESKWTYPYYDGRYFKTSEIDQGASVILIGKNLLGLTHKRDGIKYLDIEGEEYEVIGLIGVKNQYTTWDSRILMPLTSVPESTRSEIESSGCTMILYNDEKLPMDDFNTLKDKILQVDKDAMITAEELNPGSENIIIDLFAQKDSLMIFTLLVYVIALINL